MINPSSSMFPTWFLSVPSKRNCFFNCIHYFFHLHVHVLIWITSFFVENKERHCRRPPHVPHLLSFLHHHHQHSSDYPSWNVHFSGTHVLSAPWILIASTTFAISHTFWTWRVCSYPHPLADDDTFHQCNHQENVSIQSQPHLLNCLFQHAVHYAWYPIMEYVVISSCVGSVLWFE